MDIQIILSRLVVMIPFLQGVIVFLAMKLFMRAHYIKREYIPPFEKSNEIDGSRITTRRRYYIQNVNIGAYFHHSNHIWLNPKYLTKWEKKGDMITIVGLISHEFLHMLLKLQGLREANVGIDNFINLPKYDNEMGIDYNGLGL